VFAPKVIAIYKDASGLLAQRISDSKASASDQSSSRGIGLGRTIKELSQHPVRLMDRGTLRLYVGLLEKELSLARAALATLDANEGVLAAGTGGPIGAQGKVNSGMGGGGVGAYGRVSSRHDSQHDVMGSPLGQSGAGQAYRVATPLISTAPSTARPSPLGMTGSPKGGSSGGFGGIGGRDIPGMVPRSQSAVLAASTFPKFGAPISPTRGPSVGPPSATASSNPSLLLAAAAMASNTGSSGNRSKEAPSISSSSSGGLLGFGSSSGSGSNPQATTTGQGAGATSSLAGSSSKTLQRTSSLSSTLAFSVGTPPPGLATSGGGGGGAAGPSSRAAIASRHMTEIKGMGHASLPDSPSQSSLATDGPVESLELPPTSGATSARPRSSSGAGTETRFRISSQPTASASGMGGLPPTSPPQVRFVATPTGLPSTSAGSIDHGSSSGSVATPPTGAGLAVTIASPPSTETRPLLPPPSV
jgi:hypothetical protein